MLMMLPFEAPTIFEGIHKSYFRMPRVVKDQRSKFENDELFRQLSHESAVKYTGLKDRKPEERQSGFLQHLQEGHLDISVLQSGTQFTLMFNPPISPNYATESCDYKREKGRVHLKSPFILNGVCVIWRGWIDIQRLEGFGCLEFDTEGAQMEDNLLSNDRLGYIGPPPLPSSSGLLNHHSHHKAPPPPPDFKPLPQAQLAPPLVSMANLHYSNAIAAAAVYQASSGPPGPGWH